MSHYTYLERVLPQFFERAGVDGGMKWNGGIIVAHGDKGYGYRSYWEEHGIPFAKGMAVFLLTYCTPYSNEVRETDKGWVEVKQWVVDNYPRFETMLPDIIPEDDC